MRFYLYIPFTTSGHSEDGAQSVGYWCIHGRGFITGDMDLTQWAGSILI